MIPQAMSTPSATTSNLLNQVADRTSPRPQSPQVVQALLDTERAARHPRPSLALESLLGQWQLRFTAPNKPAYKSGVPTGKGFYWPVLVPGTIRFSRSVPVSPGPVSDASIPDTSVLGSSTADAPTSASPNPDRLTIENQIRLGPLALQFSGPAKFLAKQNLLAFDFVQLQVSVGGLRLFKFPIKGRSSSEDFATIPIAKLPFFAFFAATEQYLAARGRGGGLALWVKQATATPMGLQ